MPHCIYPTISNRIELPSISIWIQKCRLITKTRQRPFSTGHTRARIICRSTESKLMLDRSTYLRSMKHFSCRLASYCNLFSIGLFDFGGCEFHARLYTSTSSLSTASFPLPCHSSVSVSSHSRVESNVYARGKYWCEKWIKAKTDASQNNRNSIYLHII